MSGAQLEALAAGMNEEIKRQNFVLNACVKRIAELEAALRDLLRYHGPDPMPGVDVRAAQAAWDRAVKISTPAE